MTSPEKLATPEINHASAETAKVLEHAIGALADILGGWRYIRQSHGDLYGVGWDRCEKSASIAIAALRTEVEALATQRQGEGDLSPADIRSWAEGVTGALGTEYASRVTAEEIALASAILATSQGVAVAQPDAPPCETCNGNGMIGGPCYREPDEGGVPCPDCGPAGAAQGEVK
jgi:hypothetical protein